MSFLKIREDQWYHIIGPVILENKILKICQCIFAISLFSPLGKGHDPSFEEKYSRRTEGRIEYWRQTFSQAHLNLQLRLA